MAGRGIDHVVIAVRDLDRVAAVYEGLGFVLTPRAQHPWGTANRLAQFPGGNFIELLEIDRPDLKSAPNAAADPPEFSFGAFNGAYLTSDEGMSMLVLQGQDSRGDVARYQAAGILAYAPFDFERKAFLPDGREVDLAFSLALTTHPDMPKAAFFTCHNLFPENFWKPEFQAHTNGANEIVEAVMVGENPSAFAAYLEAFSGGQALDVEGGIRVDTGGHAISMLTPVQASRRFPGCSTDTSEGPRFVAFTIAGNDVPGGIVPASEAGGVAIEWRRQ